MSRVKIRYIERNGQTYLSADDVRHVIREVAATEATDVCNRLIDLADSLPPPHRRRSNDEVHAGD